MGACLGIGLLAKYSLVILLVRWSPSCPPSRGAAPLAQAPGPYLALCAALVVFAPHLFWAARQHFPALQWALERTRGQDY